MTDAPHGGGVSVLWGWYLVFVLVVFVAALVSSMSERYRGRPPSSRSFMDRPPPRAA
jgi:hypothetical protein